MKLNFQLRCNVKSCIILKSLEILEFKSYANYTLFKQLVHKEDEKYRKQTFKQNITTLDRRARSKLQILKRHPEIHYAFKDNKTQRNILFKGN